MRIAWFTPFSVKSAIGKYSKSVTDELAKHCEVDIWVSNRDDLLPTSLKVIRYLPDDDLVASLKDYDFVVYNMGDHLEYHKDIYEASKMHKGIMVLHDLVLHHFFLAYYFSIKHDMDEYIRDMRAAYGHDAGRLAADSVNHKCVPVFKTDDAANYPLFERAIEGAAGVIVHSNYHAKKVDEKYFGPLKVINLPLPPASPLKNNVDGKKTLFDDRVVVTTIGHVNTNKRADKVIKVLGADPELAKKTLYVIIGFYEEKSAYIREIKSMIKKYKLGDTVKLLGYQPDEALEAYLSRTDLFINLRYPVMEGASWSVIEELSHGKPVIVTDAGVYSELPDDCVMKVNIDREEKDLQKALKKLVDDKALREEMGSKGHKYVADTFTSEKYCQAFLEFTDEVMSCAPMINLIDRAGEELDRMGVVHDMDVVDKVSKEIFSMFTTR